MFNVVVENVAVDNICYCSCSGCCCGRRVIAVVVVVVVVVADNQCS